MGVDARDRVRPLGDADESWPDGQQHFCGHAALYCRRQADAVLHVQSARRVGSRRLSLLKAPRKPQDSHHGSHFPGGVMDRHGTPCYQFGPFRLDVSEHMLVRDGHPVPLTPKIFEVLRVLVQNGGHLVEKETLLKEVWPDSFVEEGALNRSVSVLRKILGASPEAQKYIETVPKRGYRFIAPVTECFDARSASIVEPDSRSVVEVDAIRTP